MKKRLLASLMVLCMVMTLLPTAALATGGESGELDRPAVTCTAAEGCTLDEGHEGQCVTEPRKQEPSEPVCAKLEGCADDAHDVNCPLYIAPQGGDDGNTSGPMPDFLVMSMGLGGPETVELEIDKGSFSDEAEITVTTETKDGNINVRLDVSYTTTNANPMAGIYYSYNLDGELVEGNAIAQAYIAQDGGTKKCLRKRTRLQRTHGRM